MTCPFLLQEAIFSKKNPINLPLRDGPNGAQALAASGGEGRKHSADVHPRACRGIPLTPMPPAGGTFGQACRKPSPLQEGLATVSKFLHAKWTCCFFY